MNTSIKKLDDGRQTESMTSLFLSQSYQDAWDDYARSLKKEGFARWDYIVLTASNEEQAEGFHAQIALRQKEKLLPSQTRFLILPDPDGKRVGSGGATLNVLRAIAEAEGTGDFTGKKILVIHSGGDSKRVPQYSAMGKLFSPVPHELPDGRTSTLFDEFMAEMSGVAGRIREGMVLLSGDVLLLFNSLQIDFPGRGAAAVSFKENVEIGKNHGVFLMGEDGNVAKFLHKQTTESLRAQGAVNEQDSVDIDTGMVIFSPEILNGLYSLISRQGIFDKEKYDTYVNETVRLSLYGDFLYPLAGESTLEAFYEEKPEGEFCPELLAARKVVWEILRPYRMKLLRLSPAKFLHFGTTAEILKLMTQGTLHYSHLGWKSKINSSVGQNPSYDRDGTNLISRNIWKSGRPELAQASARPGSVAALNSILSTNAECGEDCYLEVSYVHPGSVIGNHVVLSYIDIHGETVPDEVVLHGLKQRDGRFERIVHPTGLFIVLLGVDGAGKTTIAENLKARYVTAFRKIDHYHSRVRVLKDISQLKKDATPIDASNPHGKKQKAGKFTSVAKFGYYFLDFLIGNVKIAIAKIKSTLVLVERYYYDYSIDKVRYNLNLSDKFLSFFEHFVLKPDVIFILTGDSKKLLDRKHEITIDEIDEQKRKLNERFINNPKAVFIDTTEGTVDECVNKMLKECNAIMRKRRKW